MYHVCPWYGWHPDTAGSVSFNSDDNVTTAVDMLSTGTVAGTAAATAPVGEEDGVALCGEAGEGEDEEDEDDEEDGEDEEGSTRAMWQG